MEEEACVRAAVRSLETMGESAREYTARFVYNACAGMLEFVHLLLISKVLFNLNTDDGMWFTYAAVFAPLPAFIVAGMRKSNIVWLLEYVVKAKTSVREVESVDKATVNVPYNEKLVLGALDIIGRGFILRILRTFGPAMAGIIWVTSITLVPTYTQIRYGAAGSPPKRTTIIGMALCTFAVLMLAFMKPLYSEEGYWNVDIEGVQALAEKQAAFYAFIVCGGVNVLKLIATARVNKSVTDEARQLTPTEVLMSSSDASAALLIPAFLLDLTWKNGFLWIKAPFQKPVRYVIAESFPDYDRSFTTENVEVFCQAFAALGLATALKAVTETKTVKKNLPWCAHNIPSLSRTCGNIFPQFSP